MLRSIKVGNVLAQIQVVEREILSEAQLVHGIYADGVVDHVRWSIPLRRRKDLHAKPIFGVHPRTHVRLDTLDPAGIPRLIDVLAVRDSQRLLNLSLGVRLPDVDGSVPLLVGVSEYVPVRRLHLRP